MQNTWFRKSWSFKKCNCLWSWSFKMLINNTEKLFRFIFYYLSNFICDIHLFFIINISFIPSPIWMDVWNLNVFIYRWWTTITKGTTDIYLTHEHSSDYHFYFGFIILNTNYSVDSIFLLLLFFLPFFFSPFSISFIPEFNF